MSKAATKPSDKTREEIEKLRDEIRYHEHRYHVLDDPEIADAEFDRLMNRLKELEAAHPQLLTPGSPTVRIGGAPRTGFQTVAHIRPMLSLDNSYAAEDLREFDRRVREGSGQEKIPPSINSTALAFRFNTRTASWYAG
jgi:DNA ligase (NAD+)